MYNIYIDTLKFCGVSKNPQGSWGIDMETTPGAIHHRKKQIIRSVFLWNTCRLTRSFDLHLQHLDGLEMEKKGIF